MIFDKEKCFASKINDFRSVLTTMKEENKDLEKDLALNQKALRKRKRQRDKKIKEIFACSKELFLFLRILY